MKKYIVTLLFAQCLMFSTALSWAATYATSDLKGTWNIYTTGLQITEDSSVSQKSYVDDAWWARSTIVVQYTDGAAYATVKAGSTLYVYSNAYGAQTGTITTGRLYLTTAGVIGSTTSYVKFSMVQDSVTKTFTLYIRHATMSLDKQTFTGVHNFGNTSTAILPFGTITGVKR